MRITATPLTLRSLTLDECQQVRAWRNAPNVLPTLRNARVTTESEQEQFYSTIVCNPAAPHRYFALSHDGAFVGMGGLTHLDREPGVGEIGLILAPLRRGMGVGSAAVDALLTEAFATLQLHAVVGECYGRNPAIAFWLSRLEDLAGRFVTSYAFHGGRLIGLRAGSTAARRSGDLKWRWERP